MPGAGLFGCGALGYDCKEPARSKDGNRNGWHDQGKNQKPLNEKSDSSWAACGEPEGEPEKKIEKRKGHETRKRNGGYN
jgi:hypothetical protein